MLSEIASKSISFSISKCISMNAYEAPDDFTNLKKKVMLKHLKKNREIVVCFISSTVHSAEQETEIDIITNF